MSIAIPIVSSVLLITSELLVQTHALRAAALDYMEIRLHGSAQFVRLDAQPAHKTQQLSPAKSVNLLLEYSII